MPNKPSALNDLLRQQLTAAQELDKQLIAQDASGAVLEIPDTGKVVTSAYEQLRNAAEYAEEHLLLQKAVKRFYKRNLFFAKRQGNDLGRELIIDLTQAGYLQGRQFGEATSDLLQQRVKQYMSAYKRLRKADVPRETADGWVLALLSTDTEGVLDPHNVQQGTLVVAYTHFLKAIPKVQFSDLPNADSYQLCLYIAIHQAILKSDADVIRYDLHRLYQQSLTATQELIRFNKLIDELLGSMLTQRLRRLVSLNGAPFRILKSMADGHEEIASLLPDKQFFMDAYEQQIDHDYRLLNRRLERGLVKSVTFIIITKLLIGISVEVPYDFLLYGSVVLLPLTVNLLFPPIYMAALMLSMHLPSKEDKRRIQVYTEQLLFGEVEPHIRIPKRRRPTATRRVIYAFLFVLPIAVTVLILQGIGFNIVQMIIFFVFFSTASFLGFRLTAMVRDLELTTNKVGFLVSLRDFFYMPFIISGQWLSRKYSRINIVARFMDIVIELPLKTLLRLVQQWVNFLREQHDELY